MLSRVCAEPDFPFDPCEDEDDSGCANCAGSGWTFECMDGQCADAAFGCDACDRPCPICNPRGE